MNMDKDIDIQLKAKELEKKLLEEEYKHLMRVEDWHMNQYNQVKRKIQRDQDAVMEQQE